MGTGNASDHSEGKEYFGKGETSDHSEASELKEGSDGQENSQKPNLGHTSYSLNLRWDSIFKF